MAGGAKETPRQKMVGMMYLVLTALLALQVSSSIIDKFVFLNQALESSVLSSEKGSANAIKQMETKIAKEREERGQVNRKAEKNLDRAKQLRKEIQAELKKLEDIKNILITKAGDGINPETGAVKNPKEEMKVESEMIGAEGSKSGLAYKMEKDLKKFVDDLNAKYGDVIDSKFPYLTKGNKDNPLYARDPVQRNKDFAQASFGQTPVVAALAVITHIQSEILRYEQAILGKLGATDLEAGVKFDKIIAIASVESKVLAPGDEFKAQLFLAASSSSLKPTITFNGSPVKINADGIGEVTQKISPGQKGKVTWKGNISFEKDGEMKSFPVEGDYTVVQPSIVVSGALPILYAQCANPIKIAVPALGANYKPSFGLSGVSARSAPGGSPGDVTLIPNGPGKLTVSVSSGGTSVGSVDFEVRKVPPPTVVLANMNGAEVNISKPIPVPPQLQIAAIPDEDFKANLPKEANYRVTSLEVTLIRGGASVKSQKISGGTINFQQFGPKKGDAFSITVLGVQRASSTGSIENITLKKGRYVSFSVR